MAAPFFLWRTRSLRDLPVAVKSALTLLLVALSALLRWSLDGLVGPLPFLLFFPAVALAAFAFTGGMGFLAAVLSTAVAIYAFVPPTFGIVGISLQWWVASGLFILLMLGAAWLVETLVETTELCMRAERQKSQLLAELNHRTKNNLQLLSSILSLQALTANEEATRRAFEDAVARIAVIGRLHATLYNSGEYEAVSLRAFLQDLCEGLQDSVVGRRPVTIAVEGDDWSVDLEHAIPLGLLVNELVTNALKHAFPDDRVGTILVSATRSGDQARLVVADDGIGFRQEQVGRPGLGSKLLPILSSQLGGRLETSGEQGTRAELSFPAQAA